MIFGPVFQVEARLTARRGRSYLLRAIYGGLLLLFAQLAYERVRATIAVYYVGLVSHRAMAEIGASLFLAVVTFQQVAIFILTPAIVAGAIANDRQRGILDHLLSTPLSGREIVLGKLASRLLNTAALILAGLPIVCLATLFGGIEPRLLLTAYAVAGATLWVLACLSILVSAFAKSSREAVIVSYLLVFTWITLPYFLRPLVLVWWPGLQPFLWPAVRALELSEPFHFAELIGRPDAGWARLWLLVALESLAGCLCTLVAMIRLNSKGARRGSWAVRRHGSGPLRLFRRPSCGLNPMAWKERHVSRLSRLLLLVCLLVGMPFLVLALDQTIDSAYKAFREVVAFGYGASDVDDSQARNAFNEVLRNLGPFAFVAWILAIASISSTSITSEREEDTWISLVGTPLTGEEILQAKRFGAFWRFRLLGLALLLFWVLGLVAGSIHFFAFLLLIAAFLASGHFTVALGTYCSLVRRTSAGATTMTIALLFVLNMAAILLFKFGTIGRETILIGCMPVHVYLGTISYDEAPRMLGTRSWMIYQTLIGVGLYAMAGILLNRHAESIFDQVADRPRSTSQPRPAVVEGIRFVDNPTPVNSAAGAE